MIALEKHWSWSKVLCHGLSWHVQGSALFARKLCCSRENIDEVGSKAIWTVYPFCFWGQIHYLWQLSLEWAILNESYDISWLSRVLEEESSKKRNSRKIQTRKSPKYFIFDKECPFKVKGADQAWISIRSVYPAILLASQLGEWSSVIRYISYHG